MKRHIALLAGLLLLGARQHPPKASSATASRLPDIPQTTGQPDRGAGAYQFTGYTIYDRWSPGR